ncbi:hypothetical protein [Cystobacter fuscus]|uniref:hypothetical protein n=1 Tax=Cystobacter fuscus TaxID=43 RepID=UPI002B2BFB8E|nr:hypothetical protein F0U63_35800 [Cystobacter fuscus]
MRFLYAPAAAGVLSKEQRGDLAAAQKPAIFMLGLLLLLMMMVPVLNLVVPALACVSVCHLQRRGWTDQAALASAATAAPDVAPA